MRMHRITSYVLKNLYLRRPLTGCTPTKSVITPPAIFDLVSNFSVTFRVEKPLENSFSVYISESKMYIYISVPWRSVLLISVNQYYYYYYRTEWSRWCTTDTLLRSRRRIKGDAWLHTPLFSSSFFVCVPFFLAVYIYTRVNYSWAVELVVKPCCTIDSIVVNALADALLVLRLSQLQQFLYRWKWF